VRREAKVLMRMSGLLLRPLHGFTLVEVLVVLVLMGLVAGLALPNLQQMYLGVERRGHLEALVAELNAMGDKAYSQGAGFEL